MDTWFGRVRTWSPLMLMPPTQAPLPSYLQVVPAEEHTILLVPVLHCSAKTLLRVSIIMRWHSYNGYKGVDDQGNAASFTRVTTAAAGAWAKTWIR